MANIPAFPRAGKEWGDKAWTEAMAEDGMTLRDYFAAKQMHALVTMLYLGPEDSQKIAELAYMQADAMLKARDAAQ